jgi:hypothetical protein
MNATRTFARLLAVGVLLGGSATTRAADDPPVPSNLNKDQQANLLKFLAAHRAPDRYVPKDARAADAPPPDADRAVTGTKEKPIRQYVAQITAHRPVPDEPVPSKADVYYYRPNPEKGKQGITVKYTVDVNTGEPVGDPQVLTKAHTPVSREELAEAVAAAQAKSEPLKALYKGRDAKAVRWEYLQMKINRKSDQFEPGDRVVRFVFTATPAEGEAPPTPVRVLVNLTKETVTNDDR